MASAWNLFVKKIFEEGRKQFGKTYKFSQALKDASKRKSEMGNASATATSPASKKKKSSKKRKSSKKMNMDNDVILQY